MLIEIGHVTRYTYEIPVRYAVQSIKMTPPSFDGQRVLAWSISAPGIETALSYRDCFGNAAHLITATSEQSETVMITKGLVETRDTAGVVIGIPDLSPLRIFLRHTRLTAADGSIRNLAAEAKGTDCLDRLHQLMNGVRDHVAYETGATREDTTAIEAFANGKGVCQDHAHIFIAAARAIGVPARYVSGYFLSGTDDPTEATHAWGEAHVEGLGWVGFDPANRQCPTERYVRLAAGLDASSAAPIRGTRRGGGAETLDVVVNVQQQVAQQ